MTPRRFLYLTVVCGLLFLLFPGIDLWVSGLFYTPGAGFALGLQQPFAFVRAAVPYFLILSLIATGGVFLVNRISEKRIAGLDSRGFAFVLLTLAIGPGLLVNVVFKDQWGRARPIQVTEFGGSQQFTPALLPADQCRRNCSFVAGDPSVGFFLITYALLLTNRRRLALAGAVAAGAVIGVVRVVQGGHFLSDVVFCGLTMGAVIWFLHCLLLEPDGVQRIRHTALDFWDQLRRRGVHARNCRATHLGAVAWALLGLIFLCMLFVDLPVGRWANGFDPDLKRLFALTSEIGHSTKYLVGCALLFIGCQVVARIGLTTEAEHRWRSYAQIPLYLFATVAVAGIANDILKLLVGRMRPRVYFRDQLYAFAPFHTKSDFVSFPSGHTAVAFALATALTAIWPRHAAAYFLVALLTAASRVLVGAHWVGDVIGGAFIGIAAALYVRHVFAMNGVTPAGALAGNARWQWQPLWRDRLGLRAVLPDAVSDSPVSASCVTPPSQLLLSGPPREAAHHGDPPAGDHP